VNIPSVAIVGRANVGKSTLFNALCRSRIAIVDPTPGITRDRIAQEARVHDRTVELVDTGGVGMESAVEIADDVDMQIQIAIAQAHLILFVVDARAGRHPLDNEIAQRLRLAEKQVMVVANKADQDKDAQGVGEFFALGLGDPLAVSATQGKGMEELRDRIVALLPPAEEAEARREPIKVAFVGRRNVGKSTLINFLARAPRVIVSEMPGTTRDSVDVRFEAGDLDFIAIDTAGVRKKKQIIESVDFYSHVRTENAIARADVVVHILDAATNIGKVDKQLADQVTTRYKPCVIAVNKMDLVAQMAGEEEFLEYVRSHLPGLRFAPVVCMSAKTGENVFQMLGVAHELFEQAKERVRTSELNKVVGAIVTKRRPPSRTRHLGNILYATQLGSQPPTIALFVNDSATIAPDYERYVANQLRAALPFSNVPVRLVIRRRERNPRQ